MLSLTASLLTTIPRACVAPHDKYAFCDTSLPIDKRVDDLVSRLKPEEKPPLLTARQSPLGNVSRLGVPEYDWGANCIHGVQSRCTDDGRCPTSYPNPNFMGAAFNRSMWHGMAEIIGKELRALWLLGVGEDHSSNLPHLGLDCWSPNIGIVRDPRWGRNLETPSEDPLVCGSFGTEVTRGLQEGEDARFMQAIVTLKHFDANSLEGPWGAHGHINRHSVDAKISMYDLASSYLPAFKMAVEDGKAAGIMCSYNAINGVPSCANQWLLQTVARGQWKFDGYISSDSGAVQDIYEPKNHNYSKDGPAGVTAALRAGCDIDSSLVHGDHATGSPYTWFIATALARGELDQSFVDAALKRSLRMRFRLGLFDPIDDQPYWHVPPTVVGSAEHVAKARDATRQGFVLLKNGVNSHLKNGAPDPNPNPVLPYTLGTHARHHVPGTATPKVDGVQGTAAPKVAVVGPHVNSRSAILGNYLGQMCPDRDGSVDCVQTPYEAIAALNRQAGGAAADITNASGVDVNSTRTSGMAAAMAAAHAADVIIYVGGLDGTIERESHDRHDVGLPGLQLSLVSSLVALSKPIVLVLYHGGIVIFPPKLLAAPNLAIISAGYPGIYGARALAEAIFDTPSAPATNRFGVSPVTWYSQAGWEAAHFDMLSFDMSAAPGRTYRYYQAAEPPQWPFGWGLSYSPLELSARPLSPPDATPLSTPTPTDVVVVATVENKCPHRASDAIVLAYLRPLPGTIPATEPASRLVRKLVAFERIGPIPPSETARVDLTLTAAMATLHDAHGQPRLYTGKYELIVATSGAHGPQEVVLPVVCSSTSTSTSTPHGTVAACHTSA